MEVIDSNALGAGLNSAQKEGAAQKPQVYDQCEASTLPLKEVMNVAVKSTFDFQPLCFSSSSKPVTNWLTVLAAFSSPQTHDAIRRVRMLQNEMEQLHQSGTSSPLAGESGAYKEKQKAKDEAKRRLPCITFGATFGGYGRCNAHAVPSAFFCLDLDHLSGTPLALWSACKARAREAGVVMAFVSPSGDGLKIVYVRRLADIAADSLRVVEALGLPVDSLDSACKDAARCTFATTENDILYFDPELAGASALSFFSEPPEAPSEHIPLTHAAAGAARVAYPEQIDGVDLKQATRIWLRDKYGFEIPPVGMRHTSLIAAAGAFKSVVGYNAEWLLQILPECGLPESEVRSFCEHVCTHNGEEAWGGRPASVTEAMSQAKSEAARAQWDEDVSLPPLPSGLSDLIGCYPEKYRDAATLASLPILGVLGTGMRSYSGRTSSGVQGQVQSPTIMCILEGEAASGKNSIVEPLYDALTPELQKQDAAEWAKEAESKNEIKRKKNAKDCPAPYTAKIRLISPKTSQAQLFVRQRAIGNRHMLRFTPELSEATSNRRKGGWADLTSEDKKAYDNSWSSADYANSDNIGTPVRLFYNTLYLTTPGERRKFFVSKEDGSNTRYIFIDMPYMIGSHEIAITALSPEGKARAEQLVANLMKIGQGCENEEKFYDLHFLDQERTFWANHMGDVASQTQNRALDVFRKRSATTAFRAAMIIAALWDTEGNWTLEQQEYIKQFFHYVAQKTLSGLMNRYENDYNSPAPTYSGGFKYAELFAALPTETTTAEIDALAKKFGYTRAGAKIADDLKKAGKLTPTGRGKYTKSTPASA